MNEYNIIKSSAMLFVGLGLTNNAFSQIDISVRNNDSRIIKKEYKKIFGEEESNIDFGATRPNILLITSDQQYWMGMGYNDSTLKTPNLDRLAALGTIFDRAYSTSPVSTPARASIITGLYPSQHGAIALGTKLSETVPTLGNYLKLAKYNSAIIGKAHFMPLAGNPTYPSLEAYPLLQDLDFWKKYKGPFYGFDVAELGRPHGDESHVGQHYALWMINKLKREGKDPDTWKNWYQKPGELKYAKIREAVYNILIENGATGNKQEGVWNIPEEYHLNAWIAEQTNVQISKFIKQKQPFFIWASFFDPHPPYLVPEPWKSMYRPEDMTLPDVPENDLDDMPYQYRMTQLADSIGWQRKYSENNFGVHGMEYQGGLSKQQLKEYKAIYQGMITKMDKYIGKIIDYLEANNQLENTIVVFTTDHGNHIGTHNLNKKGAFAFEEDLRIPFFVTWKNKLPNNERTNSIVSLVDLAPTFLSLAGYKTSPKMTGINLMPLLKGETENVRTGVICENHFQSTKFYQKSYIENRYKITWYMNSDEGELFDLQTDPHEYNNLWNKPEYKELKMQMLIRAMQENMRIEPVWMPRLGPA